MKRVEFKLLQLPRGFCELYGDPAAEAHSVCLHVHDVVLGSNRHGNSKEGGKLHVWYHMASKLFIFTFTLHEATSKRTGRTPSCTHAMCLQQVCLLTIFSVLGAVELASSRLLSLTNCTGCPSCDRGLTTSKQVRRPAPRIPFTQFTTFTGRRVAASAHFICTQCAYARINCPLRSNETSQAHTGTDYTLCTHSNREFQ